MISLYPTKKELHNKVRTYLTRNLMGQCPGLKDLDKSNMIFPCLSVLWQPAYSHVGLGHWLNMYTSTWETSRELGKGSIGVEVRLS